jgi:hydroxyacylglutathione hydrolase
VTPEIIVVPCLSDNYAYLVKAGDACAVVDPSEPGPIRAALKARGWGLSHILNTHHHLDHTGGNLALKEEFGAKVVGPGKDAARIPGLDIGVDEASGWEFAGAKVPVLEVPAHTRGAITFVIAGNAFTGDTLFAMGCGRMFEGNAEQMWSSLGKLKGLPPDTRVYCGHEYTRTNARFAVTVDPENAALAARAEQVERLRAENKPTIPSTMGLEYETNPFLRADEQSIARAVGLAGADPVTVFAEIRQRKDNF